MSHQTSLYPDKREWWWQKENVYYCLLKVKKVWLWCFYCFLRSLITFNAISLVCCFVKPISSSCKCVLADSATENGNCRGHKWEAKRSAAPEIHRWFKLEELDICEHNPKFFSRGIGEFDSLIWGKILVLLVFFQLKKTKENSKKEKGLIEHIHHIRAPKITFSIFYVIWESNTSISTWNSNCSDPIGLTFTT